MPSSDPSAGPGRPTRRTVLAAAVGALTASCAPTADPAPTTRTGGLDPPHQDAALDLRALHQDGVLAPPAALTLTAFDVTAADRAGLAAALRAAGEIPGAVVSVGASLFDGRFGLAPPRLLRPMPAFRADVLDPAWCHGDLLVGAPDPAAVSLPGTRRLWQISGTAHERNLFGFREGAGNPAPDLADDLVWAGRDEPAWCAGGTYLVVRLIRLAMPTWNAESTEEHERVFGRTKDTDLPLGQSTPDPDYATDPDGARIALDSHIRRANPRTPESQAHRVLRRGYTYRHSSEDVGQIFLCYQKDLERGFEAIQRRLAGEALERYTLPFGGGYYFVLPGEPENRPLGHTLLA
ncbi:Dyp-type peroxidase [Actinokineospora fastidiosa]|uniref:Iron-dependent peroxidase n=1 Tax=Actinokineospora fastidiosa TaxID=1816 RepID=A0A918GSI4_9PSEU|nr:Dyp-type peroxidase [Actinokineospora fastidiosa]GGS58346.1 iron-dependent peroxidase [Actinokineospora fastidiosa]